MILRKQLGVLLLQRQLISERDLELVIAEQESRKLRLGELIYEKNLVPKDALVKAIEDLTHCAYYDTERLRPGDPALGIVPRALAEKHCCVPIRLAGKSIEVAFAEPQDLIALNELAFATGLRVVPFMDFRAAIMKALVRLHDAQLNGAEPDESDSAVAESLATKCPVTESPVTESPVTESSSDFEFISASKRQSHKEALQELQANERGQQTEVVRLLSNIMVSAFEKKASDIHLEPQSDQLIVRVRIDGVLRELQTVNDEIRAQLISRIKILADLDIAERRVPQDGRLLSRLGSDCYDIRVSTLPTQHGEKVVMRVLDSRAANVPFEKLGLSPQDSAALTRLARLPQGMILVTGPTGSGKSTTLYSALNLIRSEAINITTIEDPIEYMIDGANQVQVDVKAGRTFSGCLRSVLRQDPNVVMVGEIRDAETAQIALTAAQTGHLIFSTLHTNDSTSAISRLIDLQVSPFFIASSVNAILAQRLVRKLCSCCVESSHVSDLKRGLLAMGYDRSPVVSYLPQGCEKCDGKGYSGRIGVYELLLLDDRLREAIRNGVRDQALRDLATSAGMRLLIDDAIGKVLEGITTLDEVKRVVPFVQRSNLCCTHCHSELNPKFHFCPACGTACRSDLIVQKSPNEQALGRSSYSL